MTKEELHDFGVEVVAGYLKQNGYKIHEYHPMYGMYPSIVAENKKEVIAVIVQSDVAPNVPEIKLTDKFGIIGYCNGFKTKPCYASVSFGSIDPERFDKSIALVGDGYNVRFTGLEYISKELPKIGSEEYKVFVMQFLGGYLRSKNYDAVENYISNKCTISNTISKEDIIEPCIKYFKKIFEEQPIVSHCIIKSVGNMKTLNVQKLYVEGYSDGKPGTVKILQEADKVNLLLVTENPLFNNDDPGLILNIDFDKKGKINSIEIIDPRYYEFEAYNQ